MEQKRLSLYTIDIKYVRDLAKKDDTVRSVSPQIEKEKRPFVGIVVVCGNKGYCIPLSSPKQKHTKMKNDKDFTRIIDSDGKLIGVLNFNSMIPVNESVLKKLDIKVSANDLPREKHYKKMCAKQLTWCRQNQEAIIKKANALYKMITETPEKSYSLTKRCCDFKKLEAILEKRTDKNKSE